MLYQVTELMGTQRRNLLNVVSHVEEYRWSTPPEMAEFANKELWEVRSRRGSVLLKLRRPDNIDPLKKLDDFLLELLT